MAGTVVGQIHWHTEHKQQPLASLLYVWQWDSHWHLYYMYSNGIITGIFYSMYGGGIEHRNWEDVLPLGSTPSLYYLNFTEEDTNPKDLTDLPGSWR